MIFVVVFENFSIMTFFWIFLEVIKVPYDNYNNIGNTALLKWSCPAIVPPLTPTDLLIKCGCYSESPCSTKRCSCKANGLGCILFCNCKYLL